MSKGNQAPPTTVPKLGGMDVSSTFQTYLKGKHSVFSITFNPTLLLSNVK